MSEDLTRSTIFSHPEIEPPSARKSLSRFVFERLAQHGIAANVETLRSTTRTFLLLSVSAETAESSAMMTDHGMAVGEWLMREIRGVFDDDEPMAGIFWRVLPPLNAPQGLTPVFQKARAELEAKIRERRAARGR